MTSHRLLQINVNHSARAQDLLIQAMAEWNIEVAIVAEPYAVPPADNRWRGDTAGLVAIVSKGGSAASSFVPVSRSKSYVACRWGNRAVVGVYISPNISPGDFEAKIEEIERVVRCLQPGWLLVAGDFNAKSVDWGCPVTDTRAKLLGDWAAALDFHVINRGLVPTCVAARGSSIVDITMGFPEAHGEVTDWSVSDEKTLSDHRYIVMEISSPGPVREPCARPEKSEGAPPRWSLKRLDGDMAMAAAIAKSWEVTPEEGDFDVKEEAA
ncbi:uncharacterized protein LOC105199696 [Solenopsis invicta]|uniref:uncharacterized protein LOC105199696 n=1 Tax=Solenopsis invicta TaxID=13686 RepID=UPI000595A266|nr:uncharacterized protein LOC105199696 [Solenopsis invicta]